MPIDIDEIRKGRRRDWDKLRDPEEVREEKRKLREADPEYRKRRTWFKRRADDMREQEVKDQEEFRKVKKRVTIMVLGVVALFILSSGSNLMIAFLSTKSREKKIFQLTSLVNRDIAYENYESPIDAWASWRSGWLRADATAVAKSYSDIHLDRVQGKLSDKAYASTLQIRMETGGESQNMFVARNFENPEVVQYPVFGLRDGSLATMTKTIQMEDSRGGGEITWVLVASWDEDGDVWKIEDLRPENAWRFKWKHRNQIPKSRNANVINKNEIEKDADKDEGFW